MQAHNLDAEMENWHDFEIESRKEIVALLRGIGDKRQLIRMLVRGGAEVCVTSILQVDPDANLVYLDCSVDPEQNRRILAGAAVSFETTLDKIRILFSAERVTEAQHEGRPALAMAIPASLIRLQRREFYRMTAPVSNPVQVRIPLPLHLGGGSNSFPLADISCGGIAILDNKLLLGNAVGQSFPACRIDLPETGTLVATLHIRSALDLTLLNNKSNRRFGCEFVDLPRPMLALVQRYITKLERERNARLAGLG